MTYDPTWRQIKAKMNDLHIVISDAVAKRCLNYYQEQGWIFKERRLYYAGDLE
jgi:hypothetical protein